jgi:hypothetical protein
MTTILEELNTLLAPVLPVETGVFSNPAPDAYLVLTPLADYYQLFADNQPQVDVAQVQVSIFTKSNYLAIKKQITKLLLASEFTITDRRYLGHEDDTSYHHYVIDVEKQYESEVE